MQTAQLKKAQFIPPLVSRATLATAFFSSARRKFKDLEGTGDFFAELGIPAPQVMAKLVAAFEVTGAALVGAGLFTRFAALALTPIMVVALLTARRSEFHSFVDLTGVYEFEYILLLAYLVSEGGGKASVDELLVKYRAGKTPTKKRMPALKALRAA